MVESADSRDGGRVSIALIESEIQRFLSGKEAEVLCISGHWGVGKTFAWNRFLKEAKKKNGIGLQRYSYVSLFGVSSLDEFKYSIFENTLQSSDIGIEPSLDTLESNTAAAAERFGRKSLWFLQQIPLIKNYIGGLGPVWFLSVKNTIICVDDIERRGDNLAIRDVLGLVSNLKEHKGCKVCLILNDEALEENKEEFLKYFEKVVDTSLKFAPSAEECARIALNPDVETNQLLAANCITLGISNIRLIKKIERSVRKIEPMVKTFDSQVLKQAVQSLTLLGWSVYEPTRAPSLDYLKRRRTADLFGTDKKKGIPQEEAAWNALLDVYGFTNMDEFDLALLDGIRDGYFDPVLIDKYGTELDRQLKAAKVDSSFNDAWRLYHDSFDENKEQVVSAIYDSFFKSAQNISPVNLSGTAKLLKELGRPDFAAEILKHYLDVHSKEDRRFFDLAQHPFREDINDPDVVQAFKNKYETFKNVRTPTEILLSMANSNGWTEEDITALSVVPVEEYRAVFKNHRDEELRKIINTCLQFDRISGVSATMTEISARARQALTLIGQESPINARRVQKFGITITDAVEPPSGPAPSDLNTSHET